MFDTIDYNLMDHDEVPICPPGSPNEDDAPREEPQDGYTPTSLASTPESFWEDVQGVVEGDLAELVPGGVGKSIGSTRNQKLGLLIEFFGSEGSALCRVAQHLGVPYTLV